MKLINKTILYYLLISLPLLIIAGFISYHLIRMELRDGTDEALKKEKTNAIKLIHSFSEPHNVNLSFDSLCTIRVTTAGRTGEVYTDTSIYDKEEEEYVLYRFLRSYYSSGKNNYLITVAKTTIEEDELMEGIFSTFAIVIGFLVVTFFIVNWLLSRTLWKPFYKTLSELNTYDIKKHEYHQFQNETTAEFNKLNMALSKMTEKIHSDFLQQKEFTENASHEMQTPLAVVKVNLSLLMQSPNLKEEEMNQLQAIENTLKKLSALNKTLLLLTKIENNQFKENETIHLNEVVSKSLSNYADLIQAKNIQLETNFESNLTVEMNPVLADILLSNLLQNAIRHNQEGGSIVISTKGNTLSVSNSGEALTISQQELFVRFKKNDGSKDSLGLGLSIVKSISSLYGFEISYDYSNTLHTFTLKI